MQHKHKHKHSPPPKRFVIGPAVINTHTKTHSTPEFSMGLETDNSVLSTTIPKRCEVFSSFFANIRRTFGEHFFEVRAPKMQLALRLEFLEIRRGGDGGSFPRRRRTLRRRPRRGRPGRRGPLWRRRLRGGFRGRSGGGDRGGCLTDVQKYPGLNYPI